MIYTFNTRDNIFWQLIRDNFTVTAKEFNAEVNFQFKEFLDYLEIQNLEYKQLSKALIPSRDKDKQEILLCFDTNKNPNLCFYGQYVLELIFSLLNSVTAHSIHIGDFICEIEHQEKAYDLLSKNLHYVNDSRWINSSQYFLVYINNITKNERDNLLEILKNEIMYIGYSDFTFENDLKDLLAYKLSSKCIKKGKEIIFPGETIDEHFYSFAEKGYNEYPIKQELYYSFLDYKIESSLLYSLDVSDSLNAICPFYIDLDKVNVCVKPEKLNYIKEAKAKIIKRSGMETFTEEDLQKLLKEKIRQNYIFNLEFDNWGNIRFNILFEIFCFGRKSKIIAAFKYISNENKIDLITLF